MCKKESIFARLEGSCDIPTWVYGKPPEPVDYEDLQSDIGLLSALFWSSGADTIMMPLVLTDKEKTIYIYNGFWNGFSYENNERNNLPFL